MCCLQYIIMKIIDYTMMILITFITSHSDEYKTKERKNFFEKNISHLSVLLWL